MSAILLVAAREFRQVLSTRGFWVMLLIVPLAIAVSIFASSRFAPRQSAAFTLADASGRYGPAIERRLELDYQRDVLRGLMAYVARWKAGAALAGQAWARPGAWSSDAAVESFRAEGGAAAALRRIAPSLPRGAPGYKPPPRPFVEVPPPRGVPLDQGGQAFGRAIRASLKGDVLTPKGKLPFALAVYIPKDFGAPGASARIWTSGRSGASVVGEIQDKLGAALRLRQLHASGLSPEAAARIEGLSAPVQVTDIPVDAARGIIVSRSLVPLALVYLLMLTAITTGSLMLQGLVEERANKLLESVLACVRPGALMYGKLLGLGGVGLTVVAVWAGCAVAAGFLAEGAVSDLLRPSLQALDQPWMLGAMIFYFLAGYLIVSTIFLAIGSVSDSIQDAQSYLSPVIIVIMIPVMIMMQAALRSPDSLFVQVLSWIPIYTPFAMLARMGTGAPVGEILGTAALLVVFVALELVLLGRLFRASLLAAGQPARTELFTRLLLGGEER